MAAALTQHPTSNTHSLAPETCSGICGHRFTEKPALASPWPSAASELPLFLTQEQLAHLLGRSPRTLERDRAVGCSIPFTKVGRKVFYAREDVLSHLAAASFTSTQEAKRAGTK